MIKLYYVPQTRAGRARWMLEEVGAPYELVRLVPAQGETRTPEHLARHPLGHVPVLVDGDETLFESLAIVAYLADRFPDRGLAPALSSPARGLYYQWLFYGATELEPQIELVSLHTRRLPEGERVPQIVEPAKAKLSHNLVALERALADGRPWLLGDAFSAADLELAGLLGWARSMDLGRDRPLLDAFVKRAASRPAAVRARAD